MIQETGSNHPTSLYIYTDQNSYEPMARIDTDGNQEQHIRYFHTDLNGCPEELTDANGKILWECSFQLWGKRIHEIEHESVEQNFRYQGQYLDRETGLHYNTFRYYDPDIGRFTQPDPIGLLGGFNLYQYAPNGLTWIDPWGLSRYSGVDFSGTDALYQDGVNIVKIEMTGGRYGDFKNANKIAGYTNSKGNITGRSHPEGYTWHHLNDYDSKTNTSTMQLVKIEAHEATYPHAGSVSQFEKYHDVKYETSKAKAKAKEISSKLFGKC
ncbi:hypothetical protein BGI32_06700 [Snodgrassella alvi]|uniref:RHS protein conserved region domain-containing protein n=1 Tax=Snodgrassella alvi TaxID=1196083 RepID=A0A2N9WTJ6_9NEIS|nr:RHS repeat-associated core domain-containing protein [Snodgrassella alvi]PIT14896.1 hypothetical protein BGI32_06700 [Snodgrassella alvi]